MFFHEVGNPRVHFIDLPCFGVPPPGGAFSLLQGFPSFPWVPLMLGQVASLLVADEALVVSHMLCSFTRREVGLVYVHGIGVSGRSGSSSVLSRQDVAVSPILEFPESYNVLVEFSGLIQPLLPLPAGFVLSFWEGSSGHHDSKLVGHPLLMGVHQATIEVNSAACLGQSEGGGILVEVTVKLVHVKGVDCLAGSIFDILWDKDFFKGITEFFEHLFRVRDGWIGHFDVPALGKGTSSSFTHLVKEDQHNSFVIFVDVVIYSKVGFHSQEPACGFFILSREILWESSLVFSGCGH